MADLREVFRPNKYIGRIEPDHFDPSVHTAGLMDWFAAGHEDGSWFLEKQLPSLVGKIGFVALARLPNVYVAPETYDPIERHVAAVEFLNGENISTELISNLQEHLDWSRQKPDAGKGTLRAAIRAEALARGEYDPDVLVLEDSIKRATDY